jgi:hypothetical protein
MDPSLSPCRAKKFLFMSFRPALGPTQPLCNGSFPRGQRGWGVKLTTHQLVPRSRKCGSILPFPQAPSWNFTFFGSIFEILTLKKDHDMQTLNICVLAQSVQRRVTGRTAGFRFPARARDSFFYSTLPRGAVGPTHFLSNGYRGLFPWGQSDRRVKLTTHLHIVPRPVMLGVIPPLPSTSSWSVALSVKHRDNVTFTGTFIYSEWGNAFCERKGGRWGPVRIWRVYFCFV